MEFLKGFLVGLGASIPLGPIGVLCIQRTLSKGKLSGLLTGLGTALTDTIFGAIAILSLAFIQDWITEQRDWIMAIGGFIVIFFGLRLFLTNPVKQIRLKNAGGNRYWEDFFSAIIMTITNPGALFLITGAFAIVGVDVTNSSSTFAIAAVLWGLFLGASSWWYILSTTINVFRNKFRLRQLIMINRVAGIIVMALGIISMFEGIVQLIFYS